MAFDHAQSPRLGQRTPVENPGIQLVTIATLPEIAWRGQLAYAEDIDQIVIYNGDAWLMVGSGTQTFVSSEPPVADKVGDQWLDIDTYALYYWTGLVWYEIPSIGQLNTNLRTARLVRSLDEYLTPVDGMLVTVSYVDDPPGSPDTGDVWVDRTTNSAEMWNGTSWVALADSDSATYPVETWIVQAGDARATQIDDEIQVYYQNAEPSGGLDVSNIGDAWVDTDDGNSLHIWSGASWFLVVLTEDQLLYGYDGVPGGSD